MVREKNGTKGEASERNGSADTARIFWGGLDSPKPSLCEMVAASNIYEENSMGTKIGVGKGIEAYRNAYWGSTDVPMGANVRAVGTLVCIITRGVAEETT